MPWSPGDRLNESPIEDEANSAHRRRLSILSWGSHISNVPALNQVPLSSWCSTGWIHRGAWICFLQYLATQPSTRPSGSQTKASPEDSLKFPVLHSSPAPHTTKLKKKNGAQRTALQDTPMSVQLLSAGGAKSSAGAPNLAGWGPKF